MGFRSALWPDAAFFRQRILLAWVLILSVSCQVSKEEKTNEEVTLLPDGVQIRLGRSAKDGTKTIRLRAVTTNVIQVTTSPADTFSTATRLVASETRQTRPEWEVQQIREEVTLHTDSVNATLHLRTGEITFKDNRNRPIRQKKGNRKTFASPAGNGPSSGESGRQTEYYFVYGSNPDELMRNSTPANPECD